MCKNFNSLFLLFLILFSCNKSNEKEVLSVNIFQGDNLNYRYEDFYISYSIEGEGNYKLKFVLLDDNDSVKYETEIFDSVFLSSSIYDSLNFKKMLWSQKDQTTEFYNIENNIFSIQLQIIDFYSEIVLYESNKILIEINRKHLDVKRLNSFILTDIENTEYELVKILEEKDFVFIFNFATWCGWTKISLPIVGYIDSTYNEEINTFGIEGYWKNCANEIELNKLVKNYDIAYPMCTFKKNEQAINIMQFNPTAFPCFKLIDKDRRIIYSQIGYSEYLLDSISYYINYN